MGMEEFNNLEWWNQSLFIPNHNKIVEFLHFQAKTSPFLCVSKPAINPTLALCSFLWNIEYANNTECFVYSIIAIISYGPEKHSFIVFY